MIEIHHHFDVGHESKPDMVEITEDSLKSIFAIDADPSDPLNQLIVIGFKIGSRVAAIARLACDPDDLPKRRATIETALSDLFRWSIDHAGELKDR